MKRKPEWLHPGTRRVCTWYNIYMGIYMYTSNIPIIFMLHGAHTLLRATVERYLLAAG